MTYKIEKLNDQGSGICYVDKKITFVDHAIPGDEITLEITKSTKKYNVASLGNIVNPSSKRVSSFCPFSSTCSGCNLTNYSYDETIKFKEQKLANIMHKFADLDLPITVIPSNPNLNYRNKITMKVVNGKMGYFVTKTNDIVPITKCAIASSAINEFIPYISYFDIKNGEVIIRSNYNNELLINFLTIDKLIIPDLSSLKIVGIMQNNRPLVGTDHFIEKVNHQLFNVSYDSFFQINPAICSKLFDLIKENILPHKNILDLYCGVGTLGQNIASISHHVYGIEIIPNAILNAITNAQINNYSNTDYMVGDVEKVISKIVDKIDVIIIDPPRSGLTKKTITTIKEIEPEQIIYVACDPITLARDLKLLSTNYIVQHIKGLDMFPFTYHVETITILKLKDKQ